jgi:hypothetical protein
MISGDTVSMRKRREVEYIVLHQVGEDHSIFAKPEHARLLADFLRSNGVRPRTDEDAIPGEVNILIDKRNLPSERCESLLNEWKQQCAAGFDSEK